MSEFDDNPFADPFAEPSIQQATRPTENNLAEYDPFSAGKTTTPAAINNVLTQPQQPAVMTPTTIPSDQPPAYTQTAQYQPTAAEFERRQEELERKTEELARREEQLKASTGVIQNNWPPLPGVCPIGPCFYQDINIEIVPDFQRIVRLLYYLWMFNILMLFVNVLGSLAFFISLSSGSTFGMALLYFILFTPLSYICWFRPVYKAFKSDSSINFMMFFFIFFFQTIISIAQAVGIPSLGATGWVGVAQAFAQHAYGTGVFLVLVAIGSTVLAVAMAILLLMVHNIYRTNSSASINKAQEEFLGGVLRNEHVQNIATNAASTAVRNQFSQNQATRGRDEVNEPRF